MKNCPKCGRRKPLSQFRTDGGSTSCAPCRRASRAKHIRTHYARMSPDKRHAATHRKRAEAAGVAHVPYSRTGILRRWEHRCAYCDARATHMDHITPISKGGDDVEANMLPACADCNLSKGAKLLWEWCLTFPGVVPIET